MIVFQTYMTSSNSLTKLKVPIARKSLVRSSPRTGFKIASQKNKKKMFKGQSKVTGRVDIEDDPEDQVAANSNQRQTFVFATTA